METGSYLKLMVNKSASDLFFSTGAPVNIKIEGVSKAINHEILPYGSVKQLAYSMRNDKQKKKFEATLEMNMAILVNGVGRFVSMFSVNAVMLRWLSDILKVPSPLLKHRVFLPHSKISF